MPLKSILLLTITLSLACSATADAGWGIRSRFCSGPRVARAHVGCSEGTVANATVNPVPALEPITVEESYIVYRAVAETVIGPDGQPTTVIKMVPEQLTKTRVLSTANEQIEYLKDRLQKLDRQRVSPLESRVDQLEKVKP